MENAGRAVADAGRGPATRPPTPVMVVAGPGK